jgi:hypothetical protein
MKTTRRVVISLAVGALTLRGLTFSTVAVAQQKGDYAVAMIDKIEKPQFINRRFTASY